MPKWEESEILKEIGIIGRNEAGYTKRLVLMRYFDNPPAYYIKSFNPEGRPGKNCSLTPEELENLREILTTY